VTSMDAPAKRFLGDVVILVSWVLYVALFLALWAPLLPMWANGAIVLAAITAGHGFGSAWSRRVRYGPTAVVRADFGGA